MTTTLWAAFGIVFFRMDRIIHFLSPAPGASPGSIFNTSHRSGKGSQTHLPEKEVVEPNDTTQTSLITEFQLAGPFRFQEAAIKLQSG